MALGPFSLHAGVFLQPSGYNCGLVLAANTAESITIPTGADFVRMSSTVDFYRQYDAAATVPVDDNVGVTCPLNVVAERCTGKVSISVIAAAVAIVTFEFWKADE